MKAKLIEAAKLIGVLALLGLLRLIGFASSLAIIAGMVYVFAWITKNIYASPHNYLFYSVIPALGICFLIGLFQALEILAPDIRDLFQRGRKRIRRRLHGADRT